MTERMNKDRAREELTLRRDNLKIDLEETQSTHWTDDKTTYDKRVELLTDSIQALDIAIESLEQDQETKEKMWAKQLNECEECEVINNEWVDVRDRLPSEDKDYFVTIKSRIDYSDKYYIVLAHWEKSTTDKSVKGWWTSVGWNRAEKQHLYDITNDVVAWKKVEPYERKE